MNAAVSKLQRDIWKNENPEPDGKKKDKPKAINAKRSGHTKNAVKIQRKPKISQAEYAAKTEKKHYLDSALTTQQKQSYPYTQREAGVLPPHLEVMQQTAVSQIRRGIFKLPKSSPYTEYYPAQQQETLAFYPDQSPDTKENKAKEDAKTEKSAKTHAVVAKESEAPPSETTAKNPRSKALARRQESKDELKTETNDDTKENDDQASGGARAAPERKELQRMKGVFFCEKCQKRWKSIHVYCEPGTKKVVYGQVCESCKTVQMPKRVSRLRCVTCNEFECGCEQKRDRLVEPKMMHRADLCVKCLSGDPCN